MKFDNIIWDWNGTLLNDVDIAVSSINQLLGDRNLKLLTVSQYLEVFTFPVQDYYELIGFNLSKEPFEIPANQFIAIYTKAVESCGLHDEAISTLRHLDNFGYRQFILSAMEQNQLEKTVADNGIQLYFEDLYGLSNHYAVSKVENGRTLIKARGLDPKRTLMIGDTLHDYEVAQALGCKCILVAKGHQSRERLLSSGAKIYSRLDEILF